MANSSGKCGKALMVLLNSGNWSIRLCWLNTNTSLHKVVAFSLHAFQFRLLQVNFKPVTRQDRI